MKYLSISSESFAVSCINIRTSDRILPEIMLSRPLFGLFPTVGLELLVSPSRPIRGKVVNAELASSLSID
jgi:hypothetical protein